MLANLQVSVTLLMDAYFKAFVVVRTSAIVTLYSDHACIFFCLLLALSTRLALGKTYFASILVIVTTQISLKGLGSNFALFKYILWCHLDRVQKNQKY